jgi:regulator of nucleoside diphosphate kinase
MTSISPKATNLSPDIVLGADEHRRLTDRPRPRAGRSDSDWLLRELERARVVPDAKVPKDVVRMHSAVVFRTEDGNQRVVDLVFPKEADIDSHKISVLTPIGAALIGLRAGKSIACPTRDGRKQVLTVLSVTHP